MSVEEDTKKALELVARIDEPKALLRLAANAKKKGNIEVERAARLRLYTLLPSQEPGTFKHDVWQSIFALEGALSDERGKFSDPALMAATERLESFGYKTPVQ